MKCKQCGESEYLSQPRNVGGVIMRWCSKCRAWTYDPRQPFSQWTEAKRP